jgi:acyl-CoA synthetase (AMP-forming)/AMP-acid ligase II
MQIGSMIRRAAAYYGDAPCLTEGARTLSFREFDETTDRLGRALLKKGLLPADRVAVLLPNGIDCLVTYYALAKSGLVRLGLNSRETVEEQRYKLADSGSRAIIHAGVDGLDCEIAIHRDELPNLIRGAAPGPCDVFRDPEAPYRIGYTGGTTGRPKGVTIVSRGELWEVGAFLMDLLPALAPGDIFLHAAPIAHASGAFFLPSLLRGVHSVAMPKFDPAEFFALAARWGATHTFLVPTMLAMLLEQPEAQRGVNRLRSITYGAAPIADSLLRRAEERFGKIFSQTYGQAQSPMVITYLAPEHQDRVGSCGRPYTCTDVAVVDEHDRVLPPGEPGEIVCRGPQIMAGYWNRPEDTAEAMRNGWLHTGDLGTLDQEGFFYILDRKNDMLISGGYNVYPREIEDVLVSFEGVVEAAVIGIPDEKWGDRVHAVVAGRADLDPGALLVLARQKLAGFKCPKSLEIWPELPKSAANKILRRAVRERVLASRPNGTRKP